MAFLKSIKRNLLIINIMYCLMGYLLLSGQGKNIELVITVLAIGLALSGVFLMIGYLLSKISERYKRNEFVFGAFLLIVALFLYGTKTNAYDLKMILGVAIGMSAIIKIQDMFDALAIGKKVLGTYFALALLCGVLSLFICQNILIPKNLAYYVYGVGMIFAGLSDLGSNFYLAAANSTYEANLKKEIETERIIEAAEVNINSDESKPISFIEKILYEPEETNDSASVELTDKENESVNDKN